MKKSILLAKLEAHVSYLLQLLSDFLFDVGTTAANYLKISEEVQKYQIRIVVLKYQCNKNLALN